MSLARAEAGEEEAWEWREVALPPQRPSRAVPDLLLSLFPCAVLCCCVWGPVVPLLGQWKAETVGPGGCLEGAAARVPSAVCEDPAGRGGMLLSPLLQGDPAFLTQGPLLTMFLV